MDSFKIIRLPKNVAAYAARLALPMLAIGLFALFSSLYNAWADLTYYNLIRRSVSSIALGAILFGPAVLMRVRRQTLYLAAVWLVVGLLLVTNMVYSRYAGGFLSASSLSYLWQVADTTGSIRTLLDPRLLAFMAPAVVFAGLWWPLRRWNEPELLGRRWFAAGAVGGVVLVVVAGYGYVAMKELGQYGNLIRITSHPFDSAELVRKIGIVNYNLVDAVNYLRRKKTLTPNEEAFVREHRAAVAPVQAPNAETGALAGRSVVFLQLESIQQFLVGREVNGQAVMPNLSRLAAEGRQYTNFHYTIGPGTSSDAEFVTFNSLLPLANQSVVFDYPAADYQALPARLKQAGYHTMAFHADSKNFWNRANTFPHFGFDEYVAEEGYPAGPVIGYGLNDKDFFAQTADRIAALRQPFYAHVISLSSHSPFDLPEQYWGLHLADSKLSKLQQDYLQSAHYTDAALGEFMGMMRDKGLLEKTVFVIMGDHEGFITRKDDQAFAEFLGEPQGFTDASFVDAGRIPFVVYAPGSSVAGAVDKPAGQIDIYPTLLNWLGQAAPAGVMGVDLAGDQAPLIVKRGRGLGPSIDVALRGDVLWVAHAKADNQPACYVAAVRVEGGQCAEVLGLAMMRAEVSDLVIQGNRIDLLKEAR